jgi:molybdopterin converting factor small subunit
MKSMQVKITMMGTLRKTTGVKEIILNDVKNIKALIQELVREYPTLKDELMDPVMNSPIPNTLIIVDGVEITNMEGINTPIKDGSELVFLPVTHGG